MNRIQYKLIFMGLCLLFYPFDLKAQLVLTEDELISLSLKNNPNLKKQDLQLEQHTLLKGTAKNYSNLELILETPNSNNLMNMSVMQSFQLPKVHRANQELLNQNVKSAEALKKGSSYEIRHQTRLLVQNYLFLKARTQVYFEQDSVLKAFVKVAEVEHRVGKINALEQMTLETRYQNSHQSYQMALQEEAQALKLLATFVGVQELKGVEGGFKKLSSNKSSSNAPYNPYLEYYKSLVEVEQLKTKVLQAQNSPVVITGFSQVLQSPFSLPSFRVGLGVPIFQRSVRSTIKASQLNSVVAEEELKVIEYNQSITYKTLENEFNLAQKQLDYFESYGLKQAHLIIQTVETTKRLGESSTFEYLQSLEQAFLIKLNYWESLKAYNSSVLKLNYFSSNY